jgi:uncharacterized repeat protein (TIGR01451 family)
MALVHSRSGRERQWLAIPLLLGLVAAAVIAGSAARTASAATHCDTTTNALCAEDISAVEGVEFSGEIATIHLFCGGLVTVDWGDGSPVSNATANCSPPDPLFPVYSNGTYAGTHTYAAPGSYTITLTSFSVDPPIVATSTATVRALSADLSLAMNTTNTAKSNSILLYTVSVANAGPDAAANTTLTATLPYGTSYQALTAPPGWTCNHPAVGSLGGTVTCSNPSFASGGSSAASIGVKVKAKAGKGAIIASAAVSSDTGDPNTSNNSASTATVITK